MRRFRIFSVWNMVFLMAIVVLFLLVVYPMGSIFQASLLSADTGEFTWDNYLSVFTTKFYRRCLWNSFFLSALATVLLAGILFLPFGRKKQQSLTPRAALYAVGGGALNRFANFILVLSLAHVDASVQYPMITGGVMIVCTLSALLLGEKPSRREICSVVLAFLSLLAPLCIPI